MTVIILLIALNHFFNIDFFVKTFSHILKCLKICQADIIPKIKKGLKKMARESCQNLSSEEKNKKQKYGCKR